MSPTFLIKFTDGTETELIAPGFVIEGDWFKFGNQSGDLSLAVSAHTVQYIARTDA